MNMYILEIFAYLCVIEASLRTSTELCDAAAVAPTASRPALRVWGRRGACMYVSISKHTNMHAHTHARTHTLMHRGVCAIDVSLRKALQHCSNAFTHTNMHKRTRAHTHTQTDADAHTEVYEER